jgi:hypothetical protein
MEAGAACEHVEQALRHLDNRTFAERELAAAIGHIREAQRLAAALTAYPYRRRAK